jgi:hypothetical protein
MTQTDGHPLLLQLCGVYLVLGMLYSIVYLGPRVLSIWKKAEKLKDPATRTRRVNDGRFDWTTPRRIERRRKRLIGRLEIEIFFGSLVLLLWPLCMEEDLHSFVLSCRRRWV